MAFIGVRISWLMLARKALLARVASSARSRARAIAACASLMAVMSASSHIDSPVSVDRATPLASIHSGVPSWRCMRTCERWLRPARKSW